MEIRLKLRLSRMFRASLGSCRSRNVSEDIEKSVFDPQTRRDFHLIRHLSPKVRIFPAICRPKCPETMEKDCLVSNEMLHKRKLSEQSLFFVSGDPVGRNETDTFFSSKSFSPDSSESHRRKITRNRRRRAVRRNSEMGSCLFSTKGKIQDSFAVVKRSSDPYSDFRTSMVEMIIEKQIFATNDLEQLLQCFLSLNSSHHHKIIVEVFSEICEALFSMGS